MLHQVWNAFGRKSSGKRIRAPASSEKTVPSIFTMSLPSNVTVDSSTSSRNISCQFHSVKNCRHNGVTYLDQVATAVFNVVLNGNQGLAQFISLVSRRSLLTYNPPYTTASTLLAIHASTCLVQTTLSSSTSRLQQLSCLSLFSLASLLFRRDPSPSTGQGLNIRSRTQYTRQAFFNALAATARRFQETSTRKELAEAFGIPKLARFRHVHFSSLCPSSSSQSLDSLLCFTQKSIGGTALASRRLKIIAISLTDACVPVVPSTKTIRMSAILSFPTNL